MNELNFSRENFTIVTHDLEGNFEKIFANFYLR